VALEDVEHLPQRVIAGRRVVHDAAVRLSVLRELLHVVIQILRHVVAHFHGMQAQLLPTVAHLFHELAALLVKHFLRRLDGVMLEIVLEAF